MASVTRGPADAVEEFFNALQAGQWRQAAGAADPHWSARQTDPAGMINAMFYTVRISEWSIAALNQKTDVMTDVDVSLQVKTTGKQRFKGSVQVRARVLCDDGRWSVNPLSVQRTLLQAICGHMPA